MISKCEVNESTLVEILGCEQLGLDPKKIYCLLRDPDELSKALSTFRGGNKKKGR